MKAGNLSTIAELAGVSVSTVSRVLSGKAEQARISKATAEKVYAAASSMGYSPSLLARSLNHERSALIGLVLPTVANPFFAEMAGIIISECRLRGYSIIMMDSAEDEKLFHKSITALVSRNVDGIIAAPCGREPLFLESVSRDYCPVVLVDRFYENCKLSYVTTDNYMGGRMATSRLISAGLRNIACIQGETASMPNTERVRGYLDTMKEAGLKEFVRVTGNSFSIENGYRETSLLLDGASGALGDGAPEALFTLSNTITLGAIRAIKERGLQIGGDISVISYDNNASLSFFSPSITMIGQPVADMAKLSVQILVNAIGSVQESGSGAQVAMSHLRLSPSIIEGQSIRRG